MEKGLEAWLVRLENEGVVVLSGLIAELNKLTSSEDTSANQLAEVILKDASLTTQVLRVANTVHFNPSSGPV